MIQNEKNQDEKRTICYFTYEIVNLKNVKGSYDYSLEIANKEMNQTCLFKSGVAADVEKRVVKALLNKWRYNIGAIIFAVECKNSKDAKALEKSIRFQKETVNRKQIIDETISFDDGTVLGNQLVEGWSRNAYSEWFILKSKSEVEEIINNMKLCGEEIKGWTDYIVGD